MGRTNLELWETVQSPLENQVGKRDCRFERLADYVRQEPISLQPALRLGEPLRMNEDERLQMLGPLPEWIKLWSGEFFAVDAAADQATAHVLLLHAPFQLVRCKLGELHRHGSQTYKSFRMARAQFFDCLILDLDDLAGQIPLCPIPERIDAHNLHIDSFPVHALQPGIDDVHIVAGAASRGELVPYALRFFISFHQVQSFGNQNMGVHIYRQHSLATDCDLPAFAHSG